MAINTKDLTSILLLLVGLGTLAADTTFSTGLSTLVGPTASKVVATLGVLSAVASQILRVVSVPAPVTGMQVAHVPDNSILVTTPAEVKPNV